MPNIKREIQTERDMKRERERDKERDMNEYLVFLSTRHEVS
jgi:hypothetical protein